jgi:signal transduction histidine kinase
MYLADLLPFPSNTQRYAALGFACGLVFLLIALVLGAVHQGVSLAPSAVAGMVKQDPVLWLVCSVPFWVGLTASYIGVRQDRVEEVLARREEELVERTAEVRQRAEEAEQAARAKSTFLAVMSHELRTPLTAIIGYAQVLAEEVRDEEHQYFVRSIYSGGSRLLDTLNSVLDVARLEQGRVRLNPEVLAVREEVNSAIRLLEPLAKQKGLAILLADEAPDAMIRVDRAALRRVLNNLVGNAIKFTEAGSITLRIQRDEHAVTIHVEDTGVGIEPEAMPHIFGEFVQGSEGLERRHEGTGLGLAVTRHLVRLMAGHLEVESQLGAGSVFSIVLPALVRGSAGFAAGHTDALPSAVTGAAWAD